MHSKNKTENTKNKINYISSDTMKLDNNINIVAERILNENMEAFMELAK